MRCIVKKIPDIEKSIMRYAATSTVLQVKEVGDFRAKLNGVAPINPGSYVLERVSPLVQNAADVRAKRIERNAAGLFEIVLGESDRRLRVGSDLIPAPPGGIHAKFVEEI